MKYQLLIAGVLFCFFGQAQITITSGDMPLLNDTVRYSTSSTDVSNMLNDTGANQTWNFANLVPDFQDIVKFKSALSANPLYFSAFGSSSYGTQDPDINFTLASATNVYTFYKNTSASYAADGRAFTISVLPIPQPYIGKDVIYKFPLAYGNCDTNFYYTDPVNLIVANLSSSGKRINLVDGWGSLTTPYGTFDCIRVKSTVEETDTIQISQLPFPIPVPRNQTQYKWLSNAPNGKKIPVLEIDVPSGSGGTTTIKYRDINRPEVFKPLANFSANSTTFASNSTDTCILTDESANNPNAVQWSITPNTFTYVGGTKATSPIAKIFFNAAGVYTVKLKVTYSAGVDDTTKVNYIKVAKGPTANFGSSITGSTHPLTIVYFYDSSTGTPPPTEWKWTFSPDKISYVGGTSSTSQNPIITFDSVTSYAVSLKATNKIGSNTITKNNYMAVYYTGLNDVKEGNQTVTVFPNPAHDYFELNINRNAIEHIEVYDIAGKGYQPNFQWKDENKCNVDCSQLNAGIYFVKIIYSDKQSIFKKISVR